MLPKKSQQWETDFAHFLTVSRCANRDKEENEEETERERERDKERVKKRKELGRKRSPEVTKCIEHPRDDRFTPLCSPETKLFRVLPVKSDCPHYQFFLFSFPYLFSQFLKGSNLIIGWCGIHDWCDSNDSLHDSQMAAVGPSSARRVAKIGHFGRCFIERFGFNCDGEFMTI